MEALVVLAAYASLIVELVLFPVPSEASTYQLFRQEPPRPGGVDPVSRARRRPAAVKLLCYLLPTAVGVLLFLVPLALVLFPAWRDDLFPVRWLESPLLPWLGLGLVLSGRAVTFTATLQLRRAQRRESGLCARGLFRHSRNPGLVGMYLFYLGLVIMFPCWVLLLGFAPYVINMHRRVLMEESHLGSSLGDAYLAYCSAVPRYLPLVPRR